MKYFITLSVVIAACAAGVLKDPSKGYVEGDRYFYFPGDGDDTLHLVDALEPVDTEFLTRNAERTEYQLYTRANPTIGQRIQIYDINSLYSSFFHPMKNTVFISHGWNGNGQNRMSRQLTEAFLEDADVNVIVLDWRRLANRGYPTAKDGVPSVGRHLGRFINWLVQVDNVSYNKIHLVGFSLGGHLMGNAGRETGSRVRRITALDPAGPLWGRDRERLVPTDAQYVEVIHTNSRMYGFGDPCGDADFYPNGGDSMPGCFTNSCSHSLAYDYMMASIRYNHMLSNRCETLRDAQRDRCYGYLYPMGNSNLNKSLSGIFRINTRRDYPF